MTVESVLLDLYERKGRLSPEMVVKEARRPTHPLHTHFEWDDSLAAEEYRNMQARAMIRSIQVKVVAGDEEIKARAFVPLSYIQDNEDHAYTHVNDVPPQDQELVLRRMEREWQALQRRYGHLAEFWSLVTTK